MGQLQRSQLRETYFLAAITRLMGESGVELGLAVVSGVPDAGRAVPLKAGMRLILGRHPDSGLELASIFVGRMHCEVWHDGEGVWARDLQSRSGIWVNQTQATSGHAVALRPCDRLRVASSDPAVHGFAAHDARFQIDSLLLWNFSDTPATVDLVWEGLPGDVLVRPIPDTPFVRVSAVDAVDCPRRCSSCVGRKHSPTGMAAGPTTSATCRGMSRP